MVTKRFEKGMYCGFYQARMSVKYVFVFVLRQPSPFPARVYYAGLLSHRGFNGLDVRLTHLSMC